MGVKEASDLQINQADVPCINLGQTDEAIASQIRTACMKFGFFTITGHGIDEGLIDEMFAQNKAFFALPIEEKIKIKVNSSVRGYTAREDEHLDDEAAMPDTKEGLYFSREMPESDPCPLHGPNQWPSEDKLPGYRRTSEKYIQELIKLSLRLVELVALSLDLPRNYFDHAFRPPKLPMYFCRPLHYFDVKSSDADKIYACGAHSDFGMLTVLRTSDVGGLQVKPKGFKNWLPVEPPKNSFIVNIGSTASRWTNGLYQSTPHRVMTEGKERYSVPFFFDPDFYTKVECVPTCQTEDNPAKFSPIESGAYILQLYADTHRSYEAKEE